ncbi:hypothetical protein PMAYCL1PPCAC_22176, partial [Pristionchus mayeri]
CFTVDDSLAENKMEVGFYEYFLIYGYICDNNYCNADETSAKLNLEMEDRSGPNVLTIETTTQGAC